MAYFSVPDVRLAGVAAAVPSTVVSNFDYPHIPEKDRKAFVKTTGIRLRRLAPANMTATDLCVAAAEKLLAGLGWNRDEVQALVFVTQTPDHPMPANAMLVQERLGLPASCLAFDVNQGCAGYVYGLSVLSSLLQGGQLKKGLLLVGDTITHTVSPEDKSAAPIFSDAGSASALEYRAGSPNMHFNLGTDGAGYRAIWIEEGGQRHPADPSSFLPQEIEPGIRRAPGQLAMQGLDVFNFALKRVVPNLKELLAQSGHEASEADYLVFHQANLLLNESLRRKLGIEREKVPYSLDEFGNTSCATIPVTLTAKLRQELAAGPTRLLLSGFGVGLSWGSAWIQTEGLIVPEMVILSGKE